MFCNETVLASYVKAINEVTGSALTVPDLATYSSGVTSDKRFEFVSAWGVKNRDMAAPGDLMKSAYFDVVAVFKDSSNFLNSWKVAIGGQVLMDRLDDGYQVIPPPQTHVLGWLAETVNFATKGFKEDNLIPSDMPMEALRVTFTLEKIIKANVVEDV